MIIGFLGQYYNDLTSFDGERAYLSDRKQPYNDNLAYYALGEREEFTLFSF